jgi:hypothetical protein
VSRAEPPFGAALATTEQTAVVSAELPFSGSDSLGTPRESEEHESPDA